MDQSNPSSSKSRSDSIDEGLTKQSDQDFINPLKPKFNSKGQENSMRFHSAKIRNPVNEPGYARQESSF